MCKLHKFLYSLKQTPRAWYEKLVHVLTLSKSNLSLFIRQSSITLIFILIYVDDIILTGNSNSFCSSIVHKLAGYFPIKDLGPVHYFLGLEVKRTPTSITLSQQEYAIDLLMESTMHQIKPYKTPCSTSAKLDNTFSELFDNPYEYRYLVGSLQYLTWTRPNLFFVVNLICQLIHHPRTSQLTILKRILRYFNATLSRCLQ